MRHCPVCARPTLTEAPSGADKYPAEITEKVLASNVQVSDAEIEKDLGVTREEVAQLERELSSRKHFIAFLERLQAARVGAA